MYYFPPQASEPDTTVSLLPLFHGSCDIACVGVSVTTGTMCTDDEFGSDPLEDILSFTRRPDVHLVPPLPAMFGYLQQCRT